MTIHQETKKEAGISHPAPLAYGIDDAAMALGIGRVSVYRLVNENKLRLVKVGRRSLIPASSVRALLGEAV